MKNYLERRNEIKGYKDVSETIKIEEKISTSYIRFLKDEVAQLVLYNSTLEKVLARLSQFYEALDNPLFRRGSGKRYVVVVSGNKGLVGGLWHNLTSFLLARKNNYDFFVVTGDKMKRYLEEENIKVGKAFSSASIVPQPEEIVEISNYLFEEFKNEKLSKIDIIYPKFISLVDQQSAILSFLPFRFSLASLVEPSYPRGENNFGYSQTKDLSLGLPIFEPSKREIFGFLLKKYIEVFFLKIIMEAKLSEFSARTISMEHASEKTKELIKKLRNTYFKERRRVLTQRQLENFVVHKIL